MQFYGILKGEFSKFQEKISTPLMPSSTPWLSIKKVQPLKDIMVDAEKKNKSPYLNNFDRNNALRTRDTSDETTKYPNFGRREIREKELEF